MNKVIQEITDWEFANHTYMLNGGGRLIGFLRRGETEWKMFKKPLFFTRTRRKFKTLK